MSRSAERLRGGEAAPPASGNAAREVELNVSGMTCGSCAARVQKTLGRQAGVERADVNFATERASVVFDPTQVRVDDLVAAVGKIGYGLTPAQATPTRPRKRRTPRRRSSASGSGASSWPGPSASPSCTCRCST